MYLSINFQISFPASRGVFNVVPEKPFEHSLYSTTLVDEWAYAKYLKVEGFKNPMNVE